MRRACLPPYRHRGKPGIEMLKKASLNTRIGDIGRVRNAITELVQYPHTRSYLHKSPRVSVQTPPQYHITRWLTT